MAVTDLSSAGFGLPWGQTRSYTNQLPTSFDFGNGMNWIDRQRPMLGETDSGTVFVILGFNNVRFFAPSGGGAYTPMYGALDSLSYDSGNDLFTMVTRAGSKWIFYGLDTPTNPRGQLKSFFTRSGNEITVTYSGGQLVAASRSYESAPSETTTLKYSYQYLSGSDPNAGLLELIILSRQVGAGSPINISRVNYDYHTGATANGSQGDLKQVTVERYDGTVRYVTSLNYYRYYVDNAGGIGFQHGIRYAVGYEGYLRLIQNELDADTVSNLVLAEYADEHFEYDPTTQRVTKEVVDGGSRTFTFSYTERTSTPTEDYNIWQMKTVETRPSGGGVLTVYTNYAGGVLLRQLADGSDVWCDYYSYNSDGRLVQHAEPSAVASYDDTQANLGVTLNSTSGLIHVYNYYTTNTSPAALGYLHYEAVMNGTSNPEIKLRELEYGSATAGDVTVRPVTKRIVYRTDDNMNGIATTYTHAGYYSGTVQPTQRTTTLPKVPTSENGADAFSTRIENYDEFGNVTSMTDERGYETTQQFDPATHALIQRVEDDGGLDLTTDYTVDDEGRIVQALGPAHDVGGETVRTATWNVYHSIVVRSGDIIAPGIFSELWSTQGYLKVSDSNYYLTSPPAPVSVARIDGDGRTVAQILSERDPSRVSAVLSAVENYTDQSRWARCTVNQYDDQSQLTATQVYFNIPNSGTGTQGTNYDQADYIYDAMDRQSGVRSPAGTISRSVYNVRGLTTENWIGTNDNGFASPNFDSSGTNNLVKVTSMEYDDGNDKGDGNLTQLTQHVDGNSSNDRVTVYEYDFRDRQTIVDGPLNFYQKATYDNVNRVTVTEQYDDDETGNLLAKGTTAYDTRGRVYQTTRYGVDPSDGSLGNALVDNSWYDAAGNLVKSLPAGSELFTKTIYDEVGRATATYQGYYTGTGSESYSDVSQVTASNVIFEQAISTYDETGALTFAEIYQRFHNTSGSGVLNYPTGSAPLARVSYQAMWYDGIGRPIATADYGTNNNAGPPTRPGSPPSSSDTVLVGLTGYNDRGEADTATDPEGAVTATTFDDAGRVIETVQDKGTGTLNVTTQMTYHASGQIATLTAVNADTGNQVTTYTYGTTLADSAIASNDLLAEVEYPT